ncbi:MAG: ABC transporter substrate-binding protein [Microbacteriaceae bacterium]
MRSTSLTLIGAAAASLLVLTACAPSSPSGEASDGAIVIASSEPDHLTPGRTELALDQAGAIFSPLTSLTEDGDVAYVQAESVESDDATTWTITLRDGWTFHNGEPVTSQSYVDAWNETATASNAWANSGQLSAIVGWSEMNPAEGEPTATELSGLQVVDDTTFTVELVGPDSQFPFQLSRAQFAFYPMPEAAWDDLEAFDRQPIGNGPFEIAEPWVDNEEIELTAYADYAGDVPEVQQVTFRPYANADTAYTDVLAGNADLVFVPATKLTSAETDFGDRFYAFEAPGVGWLGFPLEDPRFESTALRQAISMSIDREAVNRVIYGGIYEPSTSLTPPTVAGSPADACGEFCTFDPDRAKQLLAEAGGFDGTMELIYPGGSGLDPLFEAYANQIRQNLGIEDVVPKPTTDYAEFYDVVVGGTATGPFFSRWGALYPSQQNILRSLFTQAGGCAACTGYSNPEVDALLSEAESATTLEESYEIYAEAQDVVLADFPTVPTFSESYPYATSERIASIGAVAGSVTIELIELAEG